MPHLEPEPIPVDRMLGESDWEDQDLLTIEEATSRLDDEVATYQARVGRLVADGAPEAEVSAARERLAALSAAQARVKGTSSAS